MSRILEHKSSGEDEVISRILIQLHRAVDENFPDAMAASRQFSKTLFSENENTAIVRAPGADSAEESEGDKSQSHNVASDIPLPDLAGEQRDKAPPPQALKAKIPPPPTAKPKVSKSTKTDPKKRPVSDLRSQVATQLPDGDLETGIADETTYGEIIFWGAMLVAGLILLAYVVFAIAMD